MNKITLVCETCGKSFEREVKEHNRTLRLGKRSFCSRKCTGISNIERLKPYWEANKHILAAQSRKNIGGTRFVDEFSPFRWHLRSILKHAAKNGKEVTITLEDLKQQWDKQAGVCPYTGWKMVNPPLASKHNDISGIPDKASVDRIDSARGYVVDNIQFVALAAQYAKHAWTEEQLIEFCVAVANNNKSRTDSPDFTASFGV